MKQEITPVKADIHGYYRHYKGGIYRVVALAHHSETLEDMVVYEPLYGNTGTWVRPLSMWDEPVEVDGVTVSRFSYLGEEPPTNA